MTRTWVWIQDAVVLAIHEAQLAEHGGMAGIRDQGLLSSALAPAHNLDAHGDAAAASLVAAYAFGMARNHPFLDGSRRTAFVVMELILNLNGWILNADDMACFSTMLALATGDIGDDALADWLRQHIARE